MALENLKRTVIVISPLAIVINVAVVRLIVNSMRISVLLLRSFGLLPLCPFKIVAQCWVLIECDCLELPIRIEAVYHSEDIIQEANNGICVNELIHGGQCIGVFAILYGSKEVDHKGNSEEEGDEDEKHHGLVAALVLDHVEDEDEE